MIDVDSQNFAEQIAGVLSGEVVVGIGGAVARGDVQHAVVAEHGCGSVVPLGRPFQNAFLASRVTDGLIAAFIVCAMRYDKTRKDIDGLAGLCFAAHKYLAVLWIVRMELDPINSPIDQFQKVFSALVPRGRAARQSGLGRNATVVVGRRSQPAQRTQSFAATRRQSATRRLARGSRTPGSSI